MRRRCSSSAKSASSAEGSCDEDEKLVAAAASTSMIRDLEIFWRGISTGKGGRPHSQTDRIQLKAASSVRGERGAWDEREGGRERKREREQSNWKTLERHSAKILSCEEDAISCELWMYRLIRSLILLLVHYNIRMVK